MSEVRVIGKRTYEIIFGSDVIRNGVYLELSDRTGPQIEVMAEVFFYDEEGRVVFTSHKDEIPYNLIKWLHEAVAKEDWPVE
ncbi:hypothetical protein GCM10027277_56620 [Pseudoduganella ginsengisoli]|uniref:Uncharacterized protein n=1 Tax=Pseudoduganella ginsengisoli TaxID=1462440 RepID=A0A6L6Q3F0_9BURK|nr:hypothetical protein [Pseudoduganella ginsengisoli]MTW03964.1 hypothetical protein [Pseudoduganella ginsengisoli]